MNYSDDSNKLYLEQLKTLVKTNRCFIYALQNNIKFKKLLDWIESQNKLLNDPKFNLLTKIYWILNNLHDFPVCNTCGKKIEKNVVNLTKGYFNCCSKDCARHNLLYKEKTKQTCLEKYGVTSYTKTNECKEKTKQTCLKKYGTTAVMKNPEIQKKWLIAVNNKYDGNFYDYSIKKGKKTREEKYNDKNYNNREKSKQTCLEKYGVTSYTKSSDFIKKSTQTCLEKYGVKWYMQTPEFREKSKQTCLEKYGVTSYTKTDEYKEKTQKTNLAKYNVNWIGQSIEIKHKINSRYKFNNINFDSMSELAFYIWHIDNNIPIEREPVKFDFIVDNKIHYYIPDFKVNNTFYELKGKFLLDENNNLITKDKKITNYTIAKQKCMVDNGVVLLTYNDYLKYIIYINKKYGRNYLKQFKNI